MTGTPAHWIEHHRRDGELVGWIDRETAAPALLPIDRLGRALPPVEEWDEAEAAVEAVGLSPLMARYVVDVDGRGVEAHITQVYPDKVVLATAMVDAHSAVNEIIELPFPPGERLRELG